MQLKTFEFSADHYLLLFSFLNESIDAFISMVQHCETLVNNPSLVTWFLLVTSLSTMVVLV